MGTVSLATAFLMLEIVTMQQKKRQKFFPTIYILKAFKLNKPFRYLNAFC